MSSVTTVPAAPAAEAARHFAARLALETDAADVGSAVAAGDRDFTLLDVRSRAAYDAGHIPGAVILPYARDRRRGARPRCGDGLLVVYCWGPGCNAAQHAGARIAGLGRQVKEMLGGWEYYVREGWPVEGDAGGPLPRRRTGPGGGAAARARSPPARLEESRHEHWPPAIHRGLGLLLPAASRIVAFFLAGLGAFGAESYDPHRGSGSLAAAARR